MSFKKALTLIFLLLGTSVHAALDDSERYYAKLMLSDNQDVAATSVFYVFQSPNINPELFDIGAEILYKDTDNIIKADAKAWIIKLLAKSKSQRYSDLFEHIRLTDPREKVQKHLKKSYKQLTNSGTPYIKGETSLSALLEEPDRQADKANRQDFWTLQNGNSLQKILSTVGEPDTVETTTVSHSRPFTKIYLSHMDMVYNELGTIRLNRPKKNQHASILKTLPTTEKGSIASYISALNSGDYSAIRKAAHAMYRNKTVDSEIMQLSIDTINKNIDNSQKLSVDAMSWLCKVVGQSKLSSLQPQMLKISQTAKSSKLKNYAKKSAKALLEAS